MPRKPRPPEPLRETWWLTADEAEAVRRFREGARLAGRVFAISPEAGRRQALKTATLHVLALCPDEADTLAPFGSAVEQFHPQQSNAQQSPAEWKPKARIAAAFHGLMLIPGTVENDAARDVLEVVESVGLRLKGERGDKLDEATIVNLRKNYRAGKADPGAIRLFEQLCSEYGSIVGGLDDIEGQLSLVLNHLRLHLKRLLSKMDGSP